MKSWLISVPVWGPRYVQVFLEVAAPALFAAADKLTDPVRFLIHTDAPDQIKGAFDGRELEVRGIGPHPTYVALQEAHADAVATAKAGERVVLLNADLVVSENFLTSCRQHFEDGKQAVVLLGIRTAVGPQKPPVAASSRDLLQWAWAHRHQIIKDLEWPEGKSLLLTNLFFTNGVSIVARGFHLHPAAVIKHDAIKFKSTIDGDLLDYFPRESIHVVVDPDDCSMLEVSPVGRRFPVRAREDTPMTPGRVATSMRTRASAMHRWLVGHRIGVVGEVCDCGDEAIVRDVLALLAVSTRPSRRPTKVVRGTTPLGRRASVPMRR